MLPLFFYKRFTIDSPLSHEEAVAKLSEVLAPLRVFYFGFETRPEVFQGSVSKDGFQIARIIRYRNSFLPMLYGHFYPRETGVRIRVVMTLHPFVLVPAVSVGLFIVTVLLPFVYQVIVDGHVADLLTKPKAFIVCICLVFSLAFGIEANIASRLLKRLFEAKPPSETKA